MADIESIAKISEDVEIELEKGESNPDPIFVFEDHDEGVRKTYKLSALSLKARLSIMRINELEERRMRIELDLEDAAAAVNSRRGSLKPALPSDSDAVIEPLDQRH